MDRQEYDTLLNVFDRMIEISEPGRAEYYRGYRRGIQVHLLGTLEETVQEDFPPHDPSDGNGGDHDLDAYALGYRDGCKGLKPEYIP